MLLEEHKQVLQMRRMLEDLLAAQKQIQAQIREGMNSDRDAA
jgi:DNA-binding ferritin-like protein